jgi:hypothetical protein
LGQTPTSRYAGAMSALPQDADVSPKPVKIGIPAGSFPAQSKRRSESSSIEPCVTAGRP